MPLPLPDLDSPAPKHSTSRPLPKNEPVDNSVPSRAAWSIGGNFAYLIKVSQENAGFSGVTVMINPIQISQVRLDEMVKVASDMVNESCLTNRRKRMSAARTGIEDAKALNEKWFAADLEFFEAV